MILIKIQSLVDVITNSSTEVYVQHTDDTVKYVKEIIHMCLPEVDNIDDIFEIYLLPQYCIADELSDSDYDVLHENNISMMGNKEISRFMGENPELFTRTFDDYVSCISEECNYDVDIMVECKDPKYKHIETAISKMFSSIAYTGESNY